jgi:hypothetical protein
MYKYVILTILSSVLTYSFPAFGDSSYQVTFETEECNGDTGMATVPINDIFRIQGMECDPPNEDVKLKQLLVRSSGIHGSYDAFTITPETADMIKKEIKEYMGSKKRLLDRGRSIILHHSRD